MYLGEVLDRRLNWLPHLRLISSRATMAINVIRTLSRVSWGTNPSVLLMIYRTLVRSHLEWGCQLFSSSSRSNFEILDRAQFSALRSLMGCMKSTLTCILLSEAAEQPLCLTRAMLYRRFLVTNLSWSMNPITPKLILLNEILSRRSGLLLQAFWGMSGLINRCG